MVWSSPPLALPRRHTAGGTDDSERDDDDVVDTGGAARAAATERRRVLIVDDDEAVCEALSLVLADEGYEISVAMDGGEALDTLARSQPPHLIILDLMMPRVNGWQVWGALQASDALREVPVIVFTATGLGHGAVGHATVLSKTVDAAVLLHTIRSLLGLA